MAPHASDTPLAPPTPRWVWFLAGAAAALTLAAFLLWGLQGPAYLIDCIVALCL